VELDRTEFFLNGNQKARVAMDGDRQSRVTWFDLGGKQSEAQFIACRSWRGWCEDGTSRRWFENGKLAEETRWTAGVQDGVVKRWFDTGAQQLEERWEKGTRRTQRRWDETGTLVADDEFEDDGSRKLKR
jgi:antitoxin component YwqK of YwqJK toxin-antitoxin module